jgi:hypothetical protein
MAREWIRYTLAGHEQKAAEAFEIMEENTTLAKAIDSRLAAHGKTNLGPSDQ